MNSKAQSNALHIVIGVLLMGGGLLYLLNYNALGAVIAGLGVFVEILLNWIRTMQ